MVDASASAGFLAIQRHAAGPSNTASLSTAMESDEPTDLECIDDYFEQGQHDILDKKIRRLFPNSEDDVLPYILHAIVQQSGSALLAKYHLVSECTSIINSEPRLRNMLLVGDYKSVRLLSKDLSVSDDCTSNAPIAELFRPSEYQFMISWKSY